MTYIDWDFCLTVLNEQTEPLSESFHRIYIFVGLNAPIGPKSFTCHFLGEELCQECFECIEPIECFECLDLSDFFEVASLYWSKKSIKEMSFSVAELTERLRSLSCSGEYFSSHISNLRYLSPSSLYSLILKFSFTQFYRKDSNPSFIFFSQKWWLIVAIISQARFSQIIGL